MGKLVEQQKAKKTKGWERLVEVLLDPKLGSNKNDAELAKLADICPATFYTYKRDPEFRLFLSEQRKIRMAMIAPKVDRELEKSIGGGSVPGMRLFYELNGEVGQTQTQVGIQVVFAALDGIERPKATGEVIAVEALEEPKAEI